MASIEPLNPAAPLPLSTAAPSIGLGIFVFCVVMVLLPLLSFPRVMPAILWRTRPFWFTVAVTGTTLVAIWFATVVALGGDALNGAIQDGRYFVGEHGHYHEVSRTAYYFCRSQTIAMIAFVPLLALALRILHRAANDNHGRA